MKRIKSKEIRDAERIFKTSCHERVVKSKKAYTRKTKHK